MAKLITAEYAFRVLTDEGNSIGKAYKYKGLAECINKVNEQLDPEWKVDYFKARRSIRTFGTFATAIHSKPTPEATGYCVNVLIIYQVGYQDTTPGLVPVEVLGSGTAEKLPLERLIEQAQFEQQEEEPIELGTTWRVYYRKCNQITGQPNKLEHRIDVEAEDEDSAAIIASSLLNTGQRHLPAIVRAEYAGGFA